MAFDFINFPLDIIGYAINSINDNVFLHDEKHADLSHKSNAETLMGLADDDILDDYDEAFTSLLNYESSYVILKGMKDYYSGTYDSNIVIAENEAYKKLLEEFNNSKEKLINSATTDITEFFNSCNNYRTYNISKTYESTIESLQETENLIIK